MSSWGDVNFNGLRNFQRKMERMARGDLEKFYEREIKLLAARLLRRVVKRTPTGQYGKVVNFTTKDGKEVSFKPKDGKEGGTLKKGWTVGKVKKGNGFYEIEIKNPVEYASYVEYGHRTKNHKGWVQGKFMLTISEKEVESLAPRLLEKRLEMKLGELFDD